MPRGVASALASERKSWSLTNSSWRSHLAPGFLKAPISSYGVVDHLMLKLIQAFIRLQRIAVESGTNLNVIAHKLLKVGLAAGADNLRANLATALKDRCNDRLAFSARAGNLLSAFVGMHIAGLATDKGFIHFDFATKF